MLAVPSVVGGRKEWEVGGDSLLLDSDAVADVIRDVVRAAGDAAVARQLKMSPTTTTTRRHRRNRRNKLNTSRRPLALAAPRNTP